MGFAPYRLLSAYGLAIVGGMFITGLSPACISSGPNKCSSYSSCSGKPADSSAISPSSTELPLVYWKLPLGTGFLSINLSMLAGSQVGASNTIPFALLFSVSVPMPDLILSRSLTVQLGMNSGFTD